MEKKYNEISNLKKEDQSYDNLVIKTPNSKSKLNDPLKRKKTHNNHRSFQSERTRNKIQVILK